MSDAIKCDLEFVCLAAQAAYRVKTNDEINPNEKKEYKNMLDYISNKGYEIDSMRAPKSCGGSGDTPLSYVCLKPKEDKPGPIIISYRGTKAARDLYSDARLALLGVVEQEFRDDAFGVYEQIRQKYPNREIILTGHSLGGHLAQYVGCKAYNKHKDLRKNPSTLVRAFNSAPVNTTHAEVFIDNSHLLGMFKHYRLSSDPISALPLQSYYGDIFSFHTEEFAAHSLSALREDLPEEALSQVIGSGDGITMQINELTESFIGAINSYECRVKGQLFSNLRQGQKNYDALKSIQKDVISALKEEQYDKALAKLNEIEQDLSGTESNKLLRIYRERVAKLKEISSSYSSSSNSQNESSQNKKVSKTDNNAPSAQVNFSRKMIKEIFKNETIQNESWRQFITICLDFENFKPSTQFMKNFSLTEQANRASIVAKFKDYDNPDIMTLAVALVVYSMSVPSSPENSFGQTEAMQQFITRFNNGEIKGEVKDIIYEIIGLSHDKAIETKHFAEKQQEIGSKVELAIEKGLNIMNFAKEM